jgi:hypothetical protein
LRQAATPLPPLHKPKLNSNQGIDMTTTATTATTATAQLSATQQQILNHAAVNTDGKLLWFPETLRGGARKKVLDSLFNRALITTDGTHWFVAAEGYEALGIPCRAPITLAALEAVIESAEAGVKTKPRTRDNSKQAQVIAMLKRTEGATITQICEVTAWQSHTVRGTFAGAFKKKLGLEITSSKADGSERTYRITTNLGQP